MKKQVRRKVFETNSSSMHSLSICKNGTESRLIVDRDENKVFASFGEFGWGYDVYTDAETKLSYLLTMIAETNGNCKSNEEFYELEDFKRIEDAVKEHCNCDGIILRSEIKPCSWSENYNEFDGYIDHQSVCSLDNLLTKFGECTIEEFIFDTGIELIIDNDNH